MNRKNEATQKNGLYLKLLEQANYEVFPSEMAKAIKRYLSKNAKHGSRNFFFSLRTLICYFDNNPFLVRPSQYGSGRLSYKEALREASLFEDGDPEESQSFLGCDLADYCSFTIKHLSLAGSGERKRHVFCLGGKSEETSERVELEGEASATSKLLLLVKFLNKYLKSIGIVKASLYLTCRFRKPYGGGMLHPPENEKFSDLVVFSPRQTYLDRELFDFQSFADGTDELNESVKHFYDKASYSFSIGSPKSPDSLMFAFDIDQSKEICLFLPPAIRKVEMVDILFEIPTKTKRHSE